MDLLELKNIQAKRHPWESVRADILRRILDHMYRDWSSGRILDVGCGDGFTIDSLCKGIAPIEIDAVDINMTQKQAALFSDLRPGIHFYNDFETLPRNNHQLITLFDVLEHVDNDAHFLSWIIDNFSSGPQTKLFITVPAFDWLMTSRDIFLGHKRRYNHQMIDKLTSTNNLKIKDFGYLFFGLLPVRFASLILEYLIPGKKLYFKGIGCWEYGRFLTKLIETYLYLDCRFLLKANDFGYKIPGLTLWFLCELQR